MGFDYVVEGKIMCAPKGSLGGNQPIIRGGHDDCAPWGQGGMPFRGLIKREKSTDLRLSCALGFHPACSAWDFAAW